MGKVTLLVTLAVFALIAVVAYANYENRVHAAAAARQAAAVAADGAVTHPSATAAASAHGATDSGGAILAERIAAMTDPAATTAERDRIVLDIADSHDPAAIDPLMRYAMTIEDEARLDRVVSAMIRLDPDRTQGAVARQTGPGAERVRASYARMHPGATDPAPPPTEPVGK